MAGNIIEYIAKTFKTLRTIQLDKLGEDINYFKEHDVSDEIIKKAVMGIAAVMDFENKNPTSKKSAYSSES